MKRSDTRAPHRCPGGDAQVWRARPALDLAPPVYPQALHEPAKKIRELRIIEDPDRPHGLARGPFRCPPHRPQLNFEKPWDMHGNILKCRNHYPDIGKDCIVSEEGAETDGQGVHCVRCRALAL